VEEFELAEDIFEKPTRCWRAKACPSLWKDSTAEGKGA
jgi:hypothetical protein